MCKINIKNVKKSDIVPRRSDRIKQIKIEHDEKNNNDNVYTPIKKVKKYKKKLAFAKKDDFEQIISTIDYNLKYHDFEQKKIQKHELNVKQEKKEEKDKNPESINYFDKEFITLFSNEKKILIEELKKKIPIISGNVILYDDTMHTNVNNTFNLNFSKLSNSNIELINSNLNLNFSNSNLNLNLLNHKKHLCTKLQNIIPNLDNLKHNNDFISHEQNIIKNKVNDIEKKKYTENILLYQDIYKKI